MNDSYTIDEGSLNDCYTIVKQLLEDCKDCYKIVERLLTIVQLLVTDSLIIVN